MKLWERYCKYYVVILVFGLLPLHNVYAAETVHQLSQDLRLTQIAPDVFVVTHAFPWDCNALLVNMEAGDWLLIDTPWTDEATQLVVEWLRQEYGEGVQLTAINTHFHRDNLGGNGYLRSQQIPVYGSDLTAQLLEERGPQAEALILKWLSAPQYQRFYEVLKDAPLVPPDHHFPIDEGLQLQFGEQKIEVFYPGAGHSLDNVVVYLPDRQLLFGGCLIRALESTDLGNVRDGDVQAWPQSVKRVQQRYPDARLVIPGHGQWGDPTLLQHTLTLLQAP